MRGILIPIATIAAPDRARVYVMPTRKERIAKKGNENNRTGSDGTAWHGKRCGIGFVDEVKVNADGSLGYIRRMNGDQSHQGRHVRIPVGQFSILHVVLYDYK